MPNYIYIQLSPSQGSSTPLPLRIRADKLEVGHGGSKTLLKLNGELVGEFVQSAIQGWWIQDE